MNSRRLASWTLVALLAGCGVPTEHAPRVVEPPPGPFLAPESAGSTAPAGPATETICLVRDNQIIPVLRRIDRSPTVQEQLRHLLAGPTATERDTGLTSALPGAITAASATVTGTQAQVTVDDLGDDTGRSDEVLAFGQIVCTLTSRADITTVAFQRDGTPLGVPRADGSLSTRPLARTDYTPLIRAR